jgi:hypothetical protein
MMDLIVHWTMPNAIVCPFLVFKKVIIEFLTESYQPLILGLRPKYTSEPSFVYCVNCTCHLCTSVNWLWEIKIYIYIDNINTDSVTPDQVNGIVNDLGNVLLNAASSTFGQNQRLRKVTRWIINHGSTGNVINY